MLGRPGLVSSEADNSAAVFRSEKSRWTKSVRRKFLVALALSTTAVRATEDYGKYEGTVQTEWLDDGRKMRLLSDFSYVDPKQVRWKAPKDAVVDGASIPNSRGR